MCRLSLAWVTSENSTMLLESDILRLFFTGPYLVSSFLCSVSGVDRPSILPRQLLFCSPAINCLLSALLSNYQLPLSWVASSTLIRLPVPLPGTARFQVQESFVWFRAKTDSSAVAAYPHSATLLSSSLLLYSSFNRCVLRLFFQVFYVEFGSQHGTSNRILY